MVPPDLSQFEQVDRWREAHPREWWAFEMLEDSDQRKERALASILSERDDEAILDLVRYADALETWERATREGSAEGVPPPQQRRPFAIHVVRMTPKREQQLVYQIDFDTVHGWSGFFETNNPVHVKRVNERRSIQLTVVAEIIAQPYPFMVQLGGLIRVL